MGLRRRPALLLPSGSQDLVRTFGRCFQGSQHQHPALYQAFLAQHGFDGVIQELIGYGGRPQWVKPIRPVVPLPGRISHGDRQRCVLSWEAEVAFVSELEDLANQGVALDARAIQDLLAQRVGRPVSKGTTYRLLRRHGYAWVGRRPWWERYPRSVAERRRRQRRVMQSRGQPDNGKEKSDPTSSPADINLGGGASDATNAQNDEAASLDLPESPASEAHASV